jgi:hypothetical protein
MSSNEVGVVEAPHLKPAPTACFFAKSQHMGNKGGKAGASGGAGSTSVQQKPTHDGKDQASLSKVSHTPLDWILSSPISLIIRGLSS